MKKLIRFIRKLFKSRKSKPLPYEYSTAIAGEHIESGQWVTINPDDNRAYLIKPPQKDGNSGA